MLSQGDLTASAPPRGDDELGALVGDVENFSRRLAPSIDAMLTAANEILRKVDALRKSADSGAHGAARQANQASQIAATSEELNQTIHDIAQNASRASDTSVRAMGVAEDGRGVAHGAISSTGDLTNVIEAARAGEQGRGFAVVADEVRKLAERTMRATGEISQKIGAVQAESRQTTESMEEAAERVERARASIEAVGGTLTRIADIVVGERDQITQIAAAVEQQSTATEEISRTIEESAREAENIHDVSRDVLREVDAIAGIVDRLRGSFSGITTPGARTMILDLAKGDHRLWVNRVAAHIAGDARLESAALADHTGCRLGKWYYGEDRAACGAMRPYREMEEPHRRLHALGKDIVTEFNAGNKEKARTLFREMEGISVRIVSLLEDIEGERASRAGSATQKGRSAA